MHEYADLEGQRSISPESTPVFLQEGGENSQPWKNDRKLEIETGSGRPADPAVEHGFRWTRPARPPSPLDSRP